MDIFAYLNNIYSCRKIESALNDRVSFMWLSGNQTPDHNTINRFRSSRLKETIHDIFTQVVKLPVEMGYLSLEVVYMGGTKIKSYVKYNYFHKEEDRKFKNNGFLVQNLYNNEEQDYHVCPMGQHLVSRTGNR